MKSTRTTTTATIRRVASSDIQRKGWPTLPFQREEEEEEPFLIASPVIACQLLQFRVIKLILGGTEVDRVRFFLYFPDNFPGGFSRHTRVRLHLRSRSTPRRVTPLIDHCLPTVGGCVWGGGVYGLWRKEGISSFIRLRWHT